MPGIDEDEADNIMHGQLTTPAGFTLMGSDSPSTMPGDINNGTISISGDETDAIRGYSTPSPPAARSPCPWTRHRGATTSAS